MDHPRRGSARPSVIDLVRRGSIVEAVLSAPVYENEFLLPPSSSSPLEDLPRVHPDPNTSLLSAASSVEEDLADDEQADAVAAAFSSPRGSLLIHTLGVNGQALFAFAITSQGYPFSSHMGTMCAYCRVLGELVCIWNNDAPSLTCDYMKRRYIHWPLEVIFTAGMSGLIFNFDPGAWQVCITTLSYGLGLAVTHLIVNRSKATPKKIMECFVIALLAHGFIALSCYGTIIPTKIMKRTVDPTLTLIWAGCGVPVLNLLIRRVTVNWIWAKSSDRRSGRLHYFQRTAQMFAVCLMLTPSTLGYIACSNKGQAMSMSAISCGTEILGKVISCVVVRSDILKQMHAEAIRGRGARTMLTVMAKLAADAGAEIGMREDAIEGSPLVAGLREMIKWQEGRIRELEGEVKRLRGENNRDETRNQEDERSRKEEKEEESDHDSQTASTLVEEDGRFRHAQYMLAVQWTSEIVAEKCAILGGAIVALHSSGLEARVVVEVAAIFFVMEVVTDTLFVCIAEFRFNIPLLRIKFHRTLVKENFIILFMTAAVLTAISLCAEMAFRVSM